MILFAEWTWISKVQHHFVLLVISYLEQKAQLQMRQNSIENLKLYKNKKGWKSRLRCF